MTGMDVGRDGRQHASDPALVGRADELTALAHALDRAAAGIPRVVLLSGEPGVGKSRLLAAATDLARARGFRALGGYAPEFGGMPPYFPLAWALRPALG